MSHTFNKDLQCKSCKELFYNLKYGQCFECYDRDNIGCYNVLYKIKSDNYIRHMFIKAHNEREATDVAGCMAMSQCIQDFRITEVKRQGLWSDFEKLGKRRYQGD